MSSVPCTVCDSTKGTSVYYGGLVCGGCKIFFLRSVSNNAQYKCSAQGNCKMFSDISKGWVKCRWCRFQKCLQANMNPRAVGVLKDLRSSIQQDELLPSVTASCSSSSDSLVSSTKQKNTICTKSEVKSRRKDKISSGSPPKSDATVYHTLSVATHPPTVTTVIPESLLPCMEQDMCTREVEFPTVSPTSYIPNIDTISRPFTTEMSKDWSDFLPQEREEGEKDRTKQSSSTLTTIPTSSSEMAVAVPIAESPVVGYFKHGITRNTEHLTTSYLIGVKFLETLRREGLGASVIAQNLCMLESSCDVEEQTSNNFQFKCNLDTPLEIALTNPLQMCERSPGRLAFRDDSPSGTTRLQGRLAFRDDSPSGTTRLQGRLAFRDDSPSGTTRLQGRLAFRDDDNMPFRNGIVCSLSTSVTEGAGDNRNRAQPPWDSAVGVLKDLRSSIQQDELLPSVTASCSSSSDSLVSSTKQKNTICTKSEVKSRRKDKISSGSPPKSDATVYHTLSVATHPPTVTTVIPESLLPCMEQDMCTREVEFPTVSPTSYIPNIDTISRPFTTEMSKDWSDFLPQEREEGEKDRTKQSSSTLTTIPTSSSEMAVAVPIAESPVVGYFKHGITRNTEHLTTSYLIGVKFLETLRREGLGASVIAQNLCMLESSCDVEEQTSNNFQFKCNLDTPLEIALTNPLQMCERSPMGWTDVRVVIPSIEETISTLYCRLALHFFDWVHGLPEVELLSTNDKLTLISGQMVQIEMLTVIWKTYKYNSEGLLYSSGYHFVRNNEDNQNTTNEFDNFCDALIQYMQKEVISEIRRMNMRDEEYVLLKAITFYSNMIHLSEEGATIVRRARQKYEHILVEYIRETYPHLTRREQSLRAYQIIALNKHTMSLATVDNSYLNRMFTLNIANMQGRLIYDMHVKTYGSEG